MDNANLHQIVPDSNVAGAILAAGTTDTAAGSDRSVSLSPLHRAALAYARAGIPVFPCRAGEKRPLPYSHGFKDATTDEETINNWWGHADYNLALCPEDAGWCVIDLDNKNGQDGERTWEQICAAIRAQARQEGEPEPIPDTRTIRTPSGGLHLYFKGSLPSKAGSLGPGVDTRGKGGYVLVPPSSVDGKEYKVEKDCEPAVLSDWYIEARLGSGQHERKTAEGEYEADSPEAISYAHEYLQRFRKKNGLWGKDDPPDTYGLAAYLKDRGLSEETCVDLLSEPLPQEREWLTFTVRNAFKYGQNDPGCRPVASAADIYANALHQAQEHGEQARIKEKFMTLGQAEAAPVEPIPLTKFLHSPTPARQLRELMPGWVMAGNTVMVSGRGGSHKSRLILQLCLCLLYDRDWFIQTITPETTKVWIGDGGGRAGGVPVQQIEFLSYEDDRDEIHRRIEKLKKGFTIPTGADDPSDRFAIWPLNNARPPLLIVEEDAEITLTPFGVEMLRRWEELAVKGGHTVLWFDSFFNAIQFSGKSKNLDLCAQKVIGVLDHWCKTLNCTILAPFHPSRAGDERGDTGYSTAFQDTIRQILSVRPVTRPVKHGRPSEHEETGNYRLHIMKWNGGQQGKKITFTFDDGQLVSYGHMADQGADSAAKAAAELVIEYTYGKNERDLTALQRATLDATERLDIEKKFTARIRKHGITWKIGDGQHASAISRDHWVMQEFRSRTGNERATVEDFTRACELARAVGRLGYLDRDSHAAGRDRAPAGFCFPVPDGAGFEEDDQVY